jgi:molybdopterin converting factor small subunit
MRITVQLFAGLRERAGRDELVLDGLAAPLDLAGLKRELSLRHPELGGLAHVRAALGTRYADEAAELADGMRVHLIPPVSGG